MALKRYKGYFEVEVVCLGQVLGTVKQGDSLAVPDELAANSEWSPEIWEDVVAPESKAKNKEAE